MKSKSFPSIKFFASTLWFSFLVGFIGCSPQKSETQTGCICSFNEKDYHQRYRDVMDINFMVTGDPQYNMLEMNPDQSSATNADSVGRIIRRKICCEDYRGLLVAGDLTHFGKKIEYDRYLQFIAPFKPFTFDGLGNHDYWWAENAAVDTAAFRAFGVNRFIAANKIGWESENLYIWEEVRDRKRIPAVNSSAPNIHYSWDWEDLHLIQLNVFPGSKSIYGKPAQNPFHSIGFLKQDLETHVGNSGNPVILIHHYGFDYFSVGKITDTDTAQMHKIKQWWTPEDRQRYWDILRPYNVIAIFSGHAHYCTSCYIPWDGIAFGEGKVGADFIPTFVSGAAREGKYLECEVTDDSLIVSRYHMEDRVFRKTFQVKRGRDLH